MGIEGTNGARATASLLTSAVAAATGGVTPLTGGATPPPLAPDAANVAPPRHLTQPGESIQG